MFVVLLLENFKMFCIEKSEERELFGFKRTGHFIQPISCIVYNFVYSLLKYINLIKLFCLAKYC